MTLVLLQASAPLHFSIDGKALGNIGLDWLSFQVARAAGWGFPYPDLCFTLAGMDQPRSLTPGRWLWLGLGFVCVTLVPVLVGQFGIWSILVRVPTEQGM